jgi:FkbM family methyltransferase
MTTSLFPTKHGEFVVRPGTTDETVLREVVERAGYRKRGAVEPVAGERWLDAGANRGAFAVPFARAGSALTCYEPEPDNCALLAENLARNGVTADVHQAAITARGGGVDLYLTRSARNRYRHTTMPKHGWERVAAHADAFPAVLARVKPHGVKLDIEGAELAILDLGLDLSGLRYLVMEYHFDFDPDCAAFHRRMDYLRDNFPHVHHGRVPERGAWAWWPSGRVVRCWRP